MEVARAKSGHLSAPTLEQSPLHSLTLPHGHDIHEYPGLHVFYRMFPL